MQFSPLEFNSRRSPVMGRGGIVSTSQPLATAAGLEILSRGRQRRGCRRGRRRRAQRHRADLHRDRRGYVRPVLRGADRAGQRPQRLGPRPCRPDAGAARERRACSAQACRPYHAHTVTVPGACAGWLRPARAARDASARARCLRRPSGWRRKGFPVAPLTVHLLAERGADRQLAICPQRRAS